MQSGYEVKTSNKEKVLAFKDLWQIGMRGKDQATILKEKKDLNL